MGHRDPGAGRQLGVVWLGGQLRGRRGAFVVGEKNGTCGTAIEVPGLAALNTGG